MNLISTSPMTADDLLTLQDSERYELVGGQLVEHEMSIESSWISGQIFFQLNAYAQRTGLGWAFPDGTSYQCFGWDRERVRRPDASFILANRLPAGPGAAGHCPVSPDIAVEVVSPHDLYYNVEERVDDYLAAGTRVVWVINPANRSVMAFSAGETRPQRFGEDHDLTLEDLLPDFRCAVKSLFPPPRPVPQT